MAKENFNTRIRNEFLVSLKGIVESRGFEKRGSPSLYIRRQGAVFIGIDVDVRKEESDYVTVSPWAAVWHPALSSPEDLEKRKLDWLIRHDGDRNFCDSFYRVTWGTRLQDVIVEWKARLLKLFPVLAAIRNQTDVGIICVGSYRNFPERFMEPLNKLLASSNDGSEFGVADFVPDANLADESGELVDEERWHRFADESEFGRLLESSGFRSHRTRATPLSSPVAWYLRRRGDVYHVISVVFGDYGEQTVIRCFPWIPEMNGFHLLPGDTLPQEPGFSEFLYTARGLRSDGLGKEPEPFDVFTVSGRVGILSSLAERFQEIDTYLSAKQTAEDVLEIPPEEPESRWEAIERENYEMWCAEILNMVN